MKRTFLFPFLSLVLAVSFGMETAPLEICLAPRTVLIGLPAHPESRVQEFDHLIEPDLDAAVKTIQNAKFIIGIPFYNEEESISKLVRRLIKEFSSGSLKSL